MLLLLGQELRLGLGLFINISGQAIETVNCYYSKSISDMRSDAMRCVFSNLFISCILDSILMSATVNFVVCMVALCPLVVVVVGDNNKS